MKDDFLQRQHELKPHDLGDGLPNDSWEGWFIDRQQRIFRNILRTSRSLKEHRRPLDLAEMGIERVLGIRAIDL
jgi:hypothetical protein